MIDYIQNSRHSRHPGRPFISVSKSGGSRFVYLSYEAVDLLDMRREDRIGFAKGREHHYICRKDSIDDGGYTLSANRKVTISAKKLQVVEGDYFMGDAEDHDGATIYPLIPMEEWDDYHG